MNYFLNINESIGLTKVDFLLRRVDGHVRVWRHRNIAFHDGNVMSTKAFDGGGVAVCGVGDLLIVS